MHPAILCIFAAIFAAMAVAHWRRTKEIKKLFDGLARSFGTAKYMEQFDEDYYRFVEEMQAMVGDHTGETFRIGDDVSVRLLEVAPLAGALRFELLSEGSRGVPSSGGRGRKGPSSKRGKAGAYRKHAKRKR